MDEKALQNLTNQVRRDILRMVHAVQSGHPGGSLGTVELFTALYYDVMDYSSEFSMTGENEDMFFLSNGHISPVWYSTLARKGVIELEELNTFRKINSRLQGHPTTAEHLEGIRVASGSLGQGLSIGIGAAMAKKYHHDNHHVFVLMGDGELQEGQIWEAAMFGAHHKVGNLTGIIDVNNLQIDGKVKDVLSLGDLRMKWESFGWKVSEVNGNNYHELVDALNKSKEDKEEKPKLIMMHTVMGKGVSFMENDNKWHGSPPNDEQLAIALDELPSEMADY